MKAGKYQRSKQKFQDLCRKVQNRAQYFVFRSYTMHESSNRNVTFPLVSSSVRSKQKLCFVHGQYQKPEQKSTAKNFVGFHNHSPLSTMV